MPRPRLLVFAVLPVVAVVALIAGGIAPPPLSATPGVAPLLDADRLTALISPDPLTPSVPATPLVRLAQAECPVGSFLCTNESGQGCCADGTTCHPNKPVCCHAGTVPDPDGLCILAGSAPSGSGGEAGDEDATAGDEDATDGDTEAPQQTGPACAVCDQHLVGTLATGIYTTGRPVSFVEQAINTFERCQERAGGQCGITDGSLLARGLRNGCLGIPSIVGDDASFIECVDQQF